MGENLETEEPGEDAAAGETLVGTEALWVLREDAVLEGFESGSGEADGATAGGSEDEASLEDGTRAAIGSLAFTVARGFSSG